MRLNLFRLPAIMMSLSLSSIVAVGLLRVARKLRLLFALDADMDRLREPRFLFLDAPALSKT